MAIKKALQSNEPTLLQWLQGEPATSLHADLTEICHRLTQWLKKNERDESQLIEILQLFKLRLIDVADRLKPQLINAELPLSASFRSLNKQFSEGAIQAAEALYQAAKVLLPSQQVVLSDQAMHLLREVYVLQRLCAEPTPKKLWHTSYRLYRHVAKLADRLSPNEAETAQLHFILRFKQLMVTSAVPSGALTPRELIWVFDYLWLNSEMVELSPEPLKPESTAFWFDMEEDRPPTACIRKTPGISLPTCVYFSAAALSKPLRQQIEMLEKKVAESEIVGIERELDLPDTETQRLPYGLSPIESLSLLERLHQFWITPINREQSRYSHLYPVELCYGLLPIWRIQNDEAVALSRAKWTVSNESMGGFCLTGTEISDERITMGMPVAIRHSADDPWGICIVRWIKNRDKNRVELGLQLLSHKSTPVSIAFRGSEPRITKSGLLLPPAPGQYSNNAILAPAGTYTSRRFMLVRDKPKIYVAQGRVLGLVLQTRNIELFQYEVDPYPI